MSRMELTDCGSTTLVRNSYLTSVELQEVLSWLQQKDCWELGEIEYRLAFDYDVVYESKQSYYDLFEEAGISWVSIPWQMVQDL